MRVVGTKLAGGGGGGGLGGVPSPPPSSPPALNPPGTISPTHIPSLPPAPPPPCPLPPNPPGTSSAKTSLKCLATPLKVRSMASSLRMSSAWMSSRILVSERSSSALRSPSSSRCSVKLVYWSRALRLTDPYLFVWVRGESGGKAAGESPYLVSVDRHRFCPVPSCPTPHQDPPPSPCPSLPSHFARSASTFSSCLWRACIRRGGDSSKDVGSGAQYVCVRRASGLCLVSNPSVAQYAKSNLVASAPSPASSVWPQPTPTPCFHTHTHLLSLALVLLKGVSRQGAQLSDAALKVRLSRQQG